MMAKKSIIEELDLVPIKKEKRDIFDTLFSLAILGVLIFLFTRKGVK